MTALLPWPRAIVPGPERQFAAGPNQILGDCSQRLRQAVEWLPAWGLRLRFAVAEPAKAHPALDDSYAYRLAIGETTHISADTEWGALAALATLAQLGQKPFEVAEIRDEPHYPWRGVMIDTVRHFISLATLRRTLDAMWFYKLNVLHIHLTDDQGFRFRSTAFPELASAAAYSAAELRELVGYAADRGIRVVPELDVPGHATSWLAAHPEWAWPDAVPPTGPSTRFAVHDGCLDPDNPAVFAAVRSLFAELAAVFPDEFLHFGGDEAVAVRHGAQARFHMLVVRMVESLGRRAIGWDEALSATLPRGCAIQAWRGANARDAALDAGFDCVLSAPYYLDLFYPADVHCAFEPSGDLAAAERAMTEHPRLGHVRDGLRWMQGFASFPEMPRAATRGRLLGAEACLWSELVADELVDTRLWSRMPALAERFWGAPARDDLYDRMAASRRALAEIDIVAEDRAAIERYPALAPLIEMLEPVKWYRRLLGEAAYVGRVSGIGRGSDARPYDTGAPLNRIVDLIPPESLASRQAEADLAAGAPMQDWIAGWRAQRDALAAHPELLAELGPASEALATIAEVVAGQEHAAPAALAGPFGEYLLPIAYALEG